MTHSNQYLPSMPMRVKPGWVG